MEPSVFTRIVRGELPAAKVYEDEHTIAFMDAGQVNPGHVIVATRRQVETILDLDDELAGALFRTAARVPLSRRQGTCETSGGPAGTA